MRVTHVRDSIAARFVWTRRSESLCRHDGMFEMHYDWYNVTCEYLGEDHKRRYLLLQRWKVSATDMGKKHHDEAVVKMLIFRNYCIKLIGL